MRRFFVLFFTDLRWFFGTIIGIFVMCFIFWAIFDAQDFEQTLQRFFDNLVEISKYVLFFVLVLFLVFLGLRTMWRGVFPKSKKSH